MRTTATTRLSMKTWGQDKTPPHTTFILRYTFNFFSLWKNLFQQHRCLDNFLEKTCQQETILPLGRNQRLHRISEYSDQMKKSSYLRNSVSNDKPGFFPHTKKIITQEHGVFFLISRQKVKKLLIEVQKKEQTKKSFYAVTNYVFNLQNSTIFLNTSETKESSPIFFVYWALLQQQDEEWMLWKSKRIWGFTTRTRIFVFWVILNFAEKFWDCKNIIYD